MGCFMGEERTLQRMALWKACQEHLLRLRVAPATIDSKADHATADEAGEGYNRPC